MHTAQILSAHASLEQRKLALEDLKEQKNKCAPRRNILSSIIDFFYKA
jgi:hypothetical protein